MVLEYGLWRYSDRSLVDIPAVRVLLHWRLWREVCNRRTALGVCDAAIEATLGTMATAHHAFIALFSGEPQSLGEGKYRSIVVPDFNAQRSAVVQLLRVQMTLVHG